MAESRICQDVLRIKIYRVYAYIKKKGWRRDTLWDCSQVKRRSTPSHRSAAARLRVPVPASCRSGRWAGATDYPNQLLADCRRPMGGISQVVEKDLLLMFTPREKLSSARHAASLRPQWLATPKRRRREIADSAILRWPLFCFWPGTEIAATLVPPSEIPPSTQTPLACRWRSREGKKKPSMVGKVICFHRIDPQDPTRTTSSASSPCCGLCKNQHFWGT